MKPHAVRLGLVLMPAAALLHSLPTWAEPPDAPAAFAQECKALMTALVAREGAEGMRGKSIEEACAELGARGEREQQMALQTLRCATDDALMKSESCTVVRQMQYRAKRAECPSNVDGISTAQLAHDAAFDTYVPAPRHPRAVPGPQGISWGDGNEGFNQMGWAPDGDVRGVYWVEVSPDGKRFEVHCESDVDGDGVPAHYVSDSDSPRARMLTGNDVF